MNGPNCQNNSLDHPFECFITVLDSRHRDRNYLSSLVRNSLSSLVQSYLRIGPSPPMSTLRPLTWWMLPGVLPVFRSRVLLWMQTEGKNGGRPGNEAKPRVHQATLEARGHVTCHRQQNLYTHNQYWEQRPAKLQGTKENRKEISHCCWYYLMQTSRKFFWQFWLNPVFYAAWFNRYPDEKSLFTSMAFLQVCYTYEWEHSHCILCNMTATHHIWTI